MNLLKIRRWDGTEGLENQQHLKVRTLMPAQLFAQYTSVIWKKHDFPSVDMSKGSLWSCSVYHVNNWMISQWVVLSAQHFLCSVWTFFVFYDTQPYIYQGSDTCVRTKLPLHYFQQQASWRPMKINMLIKRYIFNSSLGVQAQWSISRICQRKLFRKDMKGYSHNSPTRLEWHYGVWLSGKNVFIFINMNY